MISYLEKTPLYPKVYFEDIDQHRAIGGVGSVCHTDHLPPSINPGERYFGGICFSKNTDPLWDPFSPAFFFLPKIEIEQRAESKTICKQLNFTLKEDLPSYDEWKKRVQIALEKIEAKELKKIVLARRSHLQSHQKINPYALIRTLRAHNPHTIVFLFALSPDLYFIGATPERLYQRKGKILTSISLAGTRKRGSSVEEDQRLAQELLSNQKEKREFGFVEDFLSSKMQTLCDDVDPLCDTQVLKLHHVQHLYQHFRGRLKEGITDQEIMNHLHPTPALGGFPTMPALHYQAKLEPFSRGWYGAPIGYLSPESADFAIGIRSLLIYQNEAYAFAGTGIVEGSDPEQEWDELNHKMRNYR